MDTITQSLIKKHYYDKPELSLKAINSWINWSNAFLNNLDKLGFTIDQTGNQKVSVNQLREWLKEEPLVKVSHRIKSKTTKPRVTKVIIDDTQEEGQEGGDVVTVDVEEE